MEFNLKYYKCKDYHDIAIKETFAANYPHLHDDIKKNIVVS